MSDEFMHVSAFGRHIIFDRISTATGEYIYQLREFCQFPPTFSTYITNENGNNNPADSKSCKRQLFSERKLDKDMDASNYTIDQEMLSLNHSLNNVT